MTKQEITIFKTYPFTVGEKINISDGPRHGDWQVIEVDDKKVTLKCPVSGLQFVWARFCYFSERSPEKEWPEKD